MHFFNRLELIW